MTNTPAPTEALESHILRAGFPLDRKALIYTFVGGSQLHGAKVDGYDDLDIYGCFIEPPTRALGVMPIEHFVWSSASDQVQNTAADVDVTMYSLRRWAGLMLKGNPAILHYLFATNTSEAAVSDVWMRHIQLHRISLLSKKSARQFLGFARAQRMRLTGEKGMGRHGQRPDLVLKYGFDTKFAMHYIRLLYECRELLEQHYITLPRPMVERQILINIRRGFFSESTVFTMGDNLNKECDELMVSSTLPDEIDPAFLSKIVADAYQYHWMTNELV